MSSLGQISNNPLAPSRQGSYKLAARGHEACSASGLSLESMGISEHDQNPKLGLPHLSGSFVAALPQQLLLADGETMSTTRSATLILSIDFCWFAGC
jgi:hypothetical protein